MALDLNAAAIREDCLQLTGLSKHDLAAIGSKMRYWDDLRAWLDRHCDGATRSHRR